MAVLSKTIASEKLYEIQLLHQSYIANKEELELTKMDLLKWIWFYSSIPLVVTIGTPVGKNIHIYAETSTSLYAVTYKTSIDNKIAPIKWLKNWWKTPGEKNSTVWEERITT